MHRPSTVPPQLAGPSGEDVGVEGNSRLTAVTGLLLLVLLAIEGYTVLDVRGLISLHVFVGVLLVAPVLLKTGSTMYRFSRYYSGKPEYVRRGPPNPVLRLLGPLVIVSSLAVLGTGLGLLAVRPGENALLTLHKASFIVWVVLMTVHVLGHLGEVVRVSWRELREQSRRQRLRLAAVVLSLAIGVAAATLVLPSASSWTHRGPDIGHHERER